MPDQEDVRKFPCPSCGGEMDFDAEQGTLAYEYCGHTSNVPVTQQEIQEYDLETALSDM